MAINKGTNDHNAPGADASVDENKAEQPAFRRRSIFEVNRTHRRNISRSQMG